MKLKFKNGGIVRLQPGGSVWNQISNPRQTYTDGYGVKRPVNESKAITIGRKVYNAVDRFLNGPSEEWYEERGMSKPNASLGVAGLVNPAGETATLIKTLSKMSASERAAMQQAFKDMQSVKMPIYDEALVMRLPRREPLYNPSTSSGISEVGGRVLGRTTRGTMSKADLVEPSYGSIGRTVQSGRYRTADKILSEERAIKNGIEHKIWKLQNELDNIFYIINRNSGVTKKQLTSRYKNTVQSLENEIKELQKLL